MEVATDRLRTATTHHCIAGKCNGIQSHGDLAQEVTAYVRRLHGLLQGAYNLLLMSNICNAPRAAAENTLHLSRVGNPQRIHTLGDVLHCSVSATHVSLYSVLLLLINPWLGKVDHGLRVSASTSLHTQTPSLTPSVSIPMSDWLGE